MPNIEEQKKYLVEMSYALNLMRNGYATLQEQRLFLVYLSRINARKKGTRLLKIPLQEFIKICDLKDKQKISYYKEITRPLLQKVVEVPAKKGYRQFTLFGYCEVLQDEDTGEWYFLIGCTEYSDELFFNLSKYVSFQIENALNLRSINQIRLYTLLKSYEYCGELTIKLMELRDILGINKEEYTSYRYFNRDILKICQNEINEKTDITFTFEPAERRGKGGAVYSINFIIKGKDKPVIEESNVVATVAPSVALPSAEQTSQPSDTPPSVSFLYSRPSEPLQNQTNTVTQDIDNTKIHPLWDEALQLAKQTDNVKNIAAYANAIIQRWDKLGYTCRADLIKAGEIKKDKVKDKPRSYDLETVSDVF